MVCFKIWKFGLISDNWRNRWRGAARVGYAPEESRDGTTSGCLHSLAWYILVFFHQFKHINQLQACCDCGCHPLKYRLICYISNFRGVLKKSIYLYPSTCFGLLGHMSDSPHWKLLNFIFIFTFAYNFLVLKLTVQFIFNPNPSNLILLNISLPSKSYPIVNNISEIRRIRLLFRIIAVLASHQKSLACSIFKSGHICIIKFKLQLR